MDIIDVNTMFGPQPAAASDLSVEELCDLMRKHGVHAACTLSTVGVLLDHNAGNGATRAACSENDDLLPVATINPQAYFGGDNPLAKFQSSGFRMVRFMPDSQGWPLDYAPFVSLLKSAGEVRLPIMIEANRPGVATRFLTAVAPYASPLILSGIDDHTLAEAIAVMRAFENVYVETSTLLATGALKLAVDSVGSGRILYGSGAPARPMASGLGVLQRAGLTESQQADVLGANARRLFGM